MGKAYSHLEKRPSRVLHFERVAGCFLRLSLGHVWKRGRVTYSNEQIWKYLNTHTHANSPRIQKEMEEWSLDIDLLEGGERSKFHVASSFFLFLHVFNHLLSSLEADFQRQMARLFLAFKCKGKKAPVPSLAWFSYPSKKWQEIPGKLHLFMVSSKL